MLTREQISEWKLKARTLAKELTKQKELYQKRNATHYSRTIENFLNLIRLAELIAEDPLVLATDRNRWCAEKQSLNSSYSYLGDYNRIHYGLHNLFCSLEPQEFSITTIGDQFVAVPYEAPEGGVR